MPKETVQEKDIAPISSFEEFGVRLASMAPALDEETDPVAYFAPQIGQMEKFALGPFQWCIVDFANQKLFEIGGMIDEFTGKPYAYWVGQPAEKYVAELAKPEHIPYWMGYIQFVYEYNLRIAETGLDARSQLLKNGRFSTTGIYFNTNSAEIKAESAGVLQEIAAILNDNPTLGITIIGHTDSDGEDAHNLQLSKARAANVKTVLCEHYGVAPDRLKTDGKGEQDPVADNGTPAGKAENRRVEFIKH